MQEAQKARERMSRNRQTVPEGFGNSSRTKLVESANGSPLRNGTQRNATDQDNPHQWEQGTRRTGGSQTTKGFAMKVFAEVREARVESITPQGTRYHIPKEFIESLDNRARGAVGDLGGAHIIASAAEDKLPILRSQFADLYLARR